MRKKCVFSAIKHYDTQSSTLADTRALSCVDLSPDGTYVVCGSWSGQSKIWPATGGFDAIAPHAVFAGCRVSDVKFASFDTFNETIATCDVTGHLTVWRVGQSRAITKLRPHSERLSKMAFLPAKEGLAAVTSFDGSWSLVDVAQEKTLLVQKGHSAPVYAVAAHPDCSLLLTGDLVGISRVWDMRSGQVALNLRGHARQVTCADFAADGVHAATGSGDNSVKIWDLRGKSLLYSIPAHFADVTAVKFQPGNAVFLATSSLDKTLRVWSAKTFRLIKTLVGHEDKVSDCVVSSVDGAIYSCSFDRTWKRWFN